MINDPFRDKSKEELKATIVAERILKDIGYHTNMSIGDEPSVHFTKQKFTRFYGNFKYSYDVHTMNIAIKSNWYKQVYLNGISSVFYNSNLSVVLDARKSNTTLREDFQDLGFLVYKVKIPILEKQTVRIPGVYKNTYAFDHIYDWTIGERYMVTVPTKDGTEHKSFAAKHPNAAAANLKKWMMKEMSSAMKV